MFGGGEPAPGRIGEFWTLCSWVAVFLPCLQLSEFLPSSRTLPSSSMLLCASLFAAKRNLQSHQLCTNLPPPSAPSPPLQENRKKKGGGAWWCSHQMQTGRVDSTQSSGQGNGSALLEGGGRWRAAQPAWRGDLEPIWPHDFMM